MPSEPTAGAQGAQGASGAQPQGGASQAQGADAQQPDAGSADNGSSTADVASLQRTLNELQRDNAKYRDNIRQRDEAQRQADEAKLSEAERNAKRLTELERSNAELTTQLQRQRVSSAVLTAATRLGFQDPGDAISLLGPDDIEVVDGQPKGVEKALKELLQRKPYLASSSARAAGSVDQGAKGGSRPAERFGDQVREALRSGR